MIEFRGLVFWLSLAWAVVAFGYNDGDDYKKWMTLGKSSVIWNSANWYDPEVTPKTSVAPVAGRKYYVPTGYTLRSPNDSANPRVTDFPGSVLAIEGTFNTPSNFELSILELWMLPGFLWSPSSTVTMKTGKVVVKGTSAKPSIMRPFLYKTFNSRWRQDFSGDTTAYINFENTGTGGNAKTGKFDRESAYASHVILSGDWSQFQGTAKITTNNYVEADAPNYRTFGGKLYINGGYFGFISNSGEYQLRELQMDYGGELRCYGISGIPTRCVYTVSKEVKFSGPSYLYYEGDLPFGKTPVIKLTGEAAANPPNLTNLGLSPYSCGGHPPDGVNFVIEDNGDGTKSIVIVREDKTTIYEGQTLTSTASSGKEDYGVLVFEDNTKVYFNVYEPSYAGSIVYCVSNRLDLQGRTVVGLSSLPTNDSITVFRLSGAAATEARASLNLNKLVFDPKLIVGDLPGNPHAVFVDNGDGTTDIRMVWDPMKHMIVSNASYDYAHSAFNPVNASYWADGEIPSPSYNGTVFAHGTIMWVQWSDQSYPNMNVLLWPRKASNGSVANADFRPHVTGLTLKGLYILGSAGISTYSGGTPTALHFPIVFKNTKDLETMYFYLRDNRILKLYEPFNSDYDVFTQIDNDNGNMGMLEMIAPNTNFHGRVTVKSGQKLTKMRLILHDGLNLGGPYTRDDGYGWKAFEIENYMIVSNDQNIVFNDPTRGLYVKMGGTIETPEGKSFQIDVPVTYGGELRKMGPGTLVLGGPAQFASSDYFWDSSRDKLVTTPVEGSNVLSIVQGSLCITSSNAVDGVAVSMAEGTKLVLNPDLGAAAKEFGALSRKPGSSFESDGPITVEFADGYRPADLRVECGILTVPADRVGDYRFNYPEQLQGRPVTFAQRANADGTVTFYLSVAGKTGMCIYFEQEP